MCTQRDGGLGRRATRHSPARHRIPAVVIQSTNIYCLYIVYWNQICCVIVSREVAVTTPPSRPPRSWNGEGEVLGVAPLLRADGSEEEAQVGLVLPEDVPRPVGSRNDDPPAHAR